MKALATCIAMLGILGYGMGAVALGGQTYTLVQGIDKFDGSAAAWRLLETNGFVVADPSYKQVFEPYLDSSLPPFITTDSAWETYQFLLSAGAKQRGAGDQSNPVSSGEIATLQSANRPMASGLDFFVGASELRSAAAVRALRRTSGDKEEKAAERILYELPTNSVAGRAMRLIASLQKPVTEGAAPAFRTEAWGDEQLWAQLGAWIDQDHPGQLRVGIAEAYDAPQGAQENGVVAPYPDFFSGLAHCARESAAAMEKAGLDERFDARAVAQRLLDGVFMAEGIGGSGDDESAKMATTRIQYKQFTEQYMETHHVGGGENSPAAQALLKDLEAVARHCLEGTVPGEADKVILQGLFDERMTTPRLMREFAVVCDNLARLARKQLDGAPISEEDNSWIANYGTTLARLHFYPDMGSDAQEHEAPVAKRIATNAAGTSVLWGGLGHPEALYVILPTAGRLHLYRGAVLTYREFSRPASDPLDDKASRERERNSDASKPPEFTASFRAEKSAADILETIATDASDPQARRDLQESLAALKVRATDADLPALVAALARPDAVTSGGPVVAGIAAAIARLNWNQSRQQLLDMVDTNDGVRAGAAVSILLQRTEWLDGDFLSAHFNLAAPRTRRVYALLLGRLPVTSQTWDALARASQDELPAVRWQGVLALGESAADAAKKVPPLLVRLSDTNDLVAAAAARVLGKLGRAGVAPILFSNLTQRLAVPAARAAPFQEQLAAMQDDTLLFFIGQENPFDPEHLLLRGQMFGRRRFAPGARRGQFTEVSALIEALGELGFHPAEETILGLLDGANADAAASALKKLAPEKLAARLTAIASDKNALPQARDDALLLLSENENAGANPMPGLIPLLDDKTIIPGGRMVPGREWRICDRAATTLGALMGRAVGMGPNMSTEQRDEQVEQVRQWLRTAY